MRETRKEKLQVLVGIDILSPHTQAKYHRNITKRTYVHTQENISIAGSSGG